MAVCPGCGGSWIEPVRAVVDSETVRGSANIVTPSGFSGGRIDRTSSSVRAARLQLPAKPQKPKVPQLLFGVIFLATLAAIGFAGDAFIQLVAHQPSQTKLDPTTDIVGSAISIIMLVAAYRPYSREWNSRLTKYRAAIDRHAAAVDRWYRTMYCHSCDRTFVP
jgi:hypothetical protein